MKSRIFKKIGRYTTYIFYRERTLCSKNVKIRAFPGVIWQNKRQHRVPCPISQQNRSVQAFEILKKNHQEISTFRLVNSNILRDAPPTGCITVMSPPTGYHFSWNTLYLYISSIFTLYMNFSLFCVKFRTKNTYKYKQTSIMCGSIFWFPIPPTGCPWVIFIMAVMFRRSGRNGTGMSPRLGNTTHVMSRGSGWRR